MDNNSGLIKISIIEDNEYMRQGWEAILDTQEDFVVIDTFDRCEKAFDSDTFGRTDVVLMDIELPGMSGIEGVKHVRQNYPDTHIIMATIFDDDDHIFKALKAGAIGYLMKKVSPDNLCRAIRDAYHGGSPMTPEIARKVIQSLHVQSRNSKPLEFTERELQILRELATGKSYLAISKDVFLSEDGVRYHIRNIYRKLEVNSRSEAVAKGIKSRIIQ